LSHLAWLDFVMEHGVTDVIRNLDLPGAISKRIRFCWSQKQHANYAGTSYYRGVKKPYRSFPALKQGRNGRRDVILPAPLAEEMGAILSSTQDNIDRHYDKPMEDHLRNHLFGIPLAKSFSPRCTSRGIEFVEVFAETLSILERQLDRKNDRRKGYNHLSSYSFLVFDRTIIGSISL
jgi:hypothetical protein